VSTTKDDSGLVGSVRMAHGSAIVMSTAANKRVFHAVPREPGGAQPRVSIVLRAIKEVIGDEELQKKVSASHKGARKRAQCKKRTRREESQSPNKKST